MLGLGNLFNVDIIVTGGLCSSLFLLVRMQMLPRHSSCVDRRISSVMLDDYMYVRLLNYVFVN